MINKVFRSQKTDRWASPDAVFQTANAEFGFTLDACALPENAKCSAFFTPDDDGLLQPWQGVVWCNPPYGNRISDWVQKAFREAHNGVKTVMLLPSKTDVLWFHNWVLGKAEIRFLKGRLRFGGSKHGAPFASMLVIFNPLP